MHIFLQTFRMIIVLTYIERLSYVHPLHGSQQTYNLRSYVRLRYGVAKGGRGTYLFVLVHTPLAADPGRNFNVKYVTDDVIRPCDPRIYSSFGNNDSNQITIRF